MYIVASAVTSNEIAVNATTVLAHTLFFGSGLTAIRSSALFLCSVHALIAERSERQASTAQNAANANITYLPGYALVVGLWTIIPKLSLLPPILTSTVFSPNWGYFLLGGNPTGAQKSVNFSDEKANESLGHLALVEYRVSQNNPLRSLPNDGRPRIILGRR